jgi:T5SS/PEP-CTERM-associated repeat protein
MLRRAYWRVRLRPSAVLVCSVIATVQISALRPAQAQSNWIGTTSDWFTGSNWQGGVPTSATNAVLDTIVPNPTVVNGPGAQALALVVGESSTGALTIGSGGTVLTGASGGFLGNGQGSTGTVTVTDLNSTWNISGQLVVGGFLGPAFGSLTVQNGGRVANTEGSIGFASGSRGQPP